MSDYVTRLERSFQIAYGRDCLTPETRDAFLCSQLLAGLDGVSCSVWISIIQTIVSGSPSYKQLCVAAKQEEKRLIELKRWRLHQERQVRNPEVRYMSHRQLVVQSGKDSDSTDTSSGKPPHECYVSGKTDQLAK